MFVDDVVLTYFEDSLASCDITDECCQNIKVPYTQRTCTLCNSNDIEDEYHVTLVCQYFRDVRKKYSIIRDLI